MPITNNRIENGNFQYDIDIIPVCKEQKKIKATNGSSNSEKIPAAPGVGLHLPSKQ